MKPESSRRKAENSKTDRHALESRTIASLMGKDPVRILVTDSGLGGMAIFAEIAARMKRDPIFSRTAMTYFNAWPEQNRGYNALKDMDERVRVLDRALAGMKSYRPDLILIACNTLSVLYDRTAFSRRETLPVIDIVRFGVDMMYQELSTHPNRMALLLGTVTTIASGIHRSQLIGKGIAPERIVSQPCDQLATQIEEGPNSDTVASMVDGFMTQAAEKLGPGCSHVSVALFCTHFGYCKNLIREALQRRTGARVSILDPNQAMAAWLFEAAGGASHARGAVGMQVVSRIVWDRAKIDAMAHIVEVRSPETARALRGYEYKPDLFTV